MRYCSITESAPLLDEDEEDSWVVGFSLKDNLFNDNSTKPSNDIAQVTDFIVCGHK